ncbi:MAG: hypothetical protein ACKOW3_09425, partial [Hyphomicrobium sp.]
WVTFVRHAFKENFRKLGESKEIFLNHLSAIEKKGPSIFLIESPSGLFEYPARSSAQENPFLRENFVINRPRNLEIFKA